KVFLLNAPTDSRTTEIYLRQCLGRLKDHLGVDVIDNVIVSFNGFEFSDNDEALPMEVTGPPLHSSSFPRQDQVHWPVPFEYIISTWQVLEALHDEGVAKSLGVSQFNHNQLERLLAYAKHRPLVDQVTLASCCAMPKQLLKYCQERDVDVQRNSDPTDILTQTDLDQITRQFPKLRHPEHPLAPKWVVKYSVLIKHRGILGNKG
ncbi:hypothetical protein BJ085DRAFT_21962, partial [Dimargaris cristalligena]